MRCARNNKYNARDHMHTHTQAGASTQTLSLPFFRTVSDCIPSPRVQD
jgi:hypothetical protein